MKNIIIPIGAAIVMGTVFAKTSTPAGWTDDFDAALKRAAAEKKLVLMDFSGSDWCCWCQRLDKEVFAQEAFAKVATNKYVCVMIDSPGDQSVLSAVAKKQNKSLVKKYGVQGFPTVLMMDAKGEVLFKTGYRPGGPAKYLEHLETMAKAAPMMNLYIKPIEEKLAKAESDIQEVICAKESELLKDVTTKEGKEEMLNQMEKIIGTEILPKRLPEFKKAIDEAKAAQVPTELEEKKSELIRKYKGMYDWMNIMMKDYGKMTEPKK